MAVDVGGEVVREFMGLLSAHAWLEQRNRDIREMPNGKLAVVATPDDYEAVYNLFRDVAYRSVTRIGKTHRQILQAVYELKEEAKKSAAFVREGFTQKEIAERAGLTQPTVSKNRAYLTKSVHLLYETDTGKLNMPDSVTPESWEDLDPMRGFPKPEDVRKWAEETPPPLPNAQSIPGTSEYPSPDPHRNGKNGDLGPRNTPEYPGISPDDEPKTELAPAAEVELADDEELFC
jgi:hypothetical protein